MTAGPGRLEPPLNVLVVGGSTSRPSRTRALMDAAAAAAARGGAAAEVWDVARAATRQPDGGPPARTSDLRALAARAHAVVVVTPTHHNSYSGLVKHALDHLPRQSLAGKPVALMTACGRQPTPQAVDHLRIVVRALGGVATPSQVVACERDFHRRPERFEVASDAALQFVASVVAELLWLGQRLRCRPAGHAALRPAAPAAAVGGAPASRSAADPLRLGRGDFPDQIMRAVEYIRENFTKGPLPLDRVASVACMSRYHFSRTFKRETGTRFIDFVTTVRLAEACSLLSETSQSITSVAFAVGYRDLSHFERTFKKEFGLSPSDYRHRVRAGLQLPPQLPWPDELAEGGPAAPARAVATPRTAA